MNFLPTIFKSTKPAQKQLDFEVEQLEPRMMLSAVQIFASGTEGGEQFQLQIDGEVAQTFEIALGRTS